MTQPDELKPFQVWHDIQKERESQNAKWGGPSHDDTHTSHDWLAYIIKHAGKAVIWPFDFRVFRIQMVRVAALAVAAIEWCDRKQVY